MFTEPVGGRVSKFVSPMFPSGFFRLTVDNLMATVIGSFEVNVILEFMLEVYYFVPIDLVINCTVVVGTAGVDWEEMIRFRK